jgi:hypothetical protein
MIDLYRQYQDRQRQLDLYISHHKQERGSKYIGDFGLVVDYNVHHPNFAIVKEIIKDTRARSSGLQIHVVDMTLCGRDRADFTAEYPAKGSWVLFHRVGINEFSLGLAET